MPPFLKGENKPKSDGCFGVFVCTASDGLASDVEEVMGDEVGVPSIVRTLSISARTSSAFLTSCPFALIMPRVSILGAPKASCRKWPEVRLYFMANWASSDTPLSYIPSIKSVLNLSTSLIGV